MARRPVHVSIQADPLRLRPATRPFAATCPERPAACDDDRDDEDSDRCQEDPVADPSWDPFGLDEEEGEPQPEHGDFWHEPDERED